MSSKKLVVLAVALMGAVVAGAAQARDRDEVQWSVTVGTPVGVPVYTQPAPVIVQPAPVYQVQRYERYDGYGHHTPYRQPTRWDRDGDGIPNRYDRLYNPVWDRDGDGIPNRYDRFDNRRVDRDGDGVPNWRDHDDGRYRHDGWGR